MAKLSQKQLEEMAKQRKQSIEDDNSDELIKNSNELKKTLPQAKIINEIMGDKNTQLYKYSLPETSIYCNDESLMPEADPDEYPTLNIMGKTSRKRQAKGFNLFLLKEIDYILSKNMKGNNMNATLNFLLWVGLQALKGMNQSIDIRIHDDTYADGMAVENYIEIKSNKVE